MRQIFSILFMLCASLGFAQTITNVDFSVDGNNIVVTYDLSNCESCDIGLFISLDGGLTFSNNSLSPVSGDVGLSVAAGSKRMVWNPLISYPNGLLGDVMFEVRGMGNVKYKDKPNKTFTVNGIAFNMIYVGPGTFKMGATEEQVGEAQESERPVHEVTLSEFYIGESEVTQELWKAVMGKNPSKFKKKSGPKAPVENVSWNDIQKFLSKLNSLTGQTFVLPTEAQWEYAARGGNRSRGYKYSGSNNIDDVAWYDGNSGDRTHTVATKQPNELGIYDMSGNVWEWCSDWYGKYDSSSQTDPRGAYSGSGRVYRGGSSWNYAVCCRVSYRDNYAPGFRDCYVGFRIALAQ